MQVKFDSQCRVRKILALALPPLSPHSPAFLQAAIHCVILLFARVVQRVFPRLLSDEHIWLGLQLTSIPAASNTFLLPKPLTWYLGKLAVRVAKYVHTTNSFILFPKVSSCLHFEIHNPPVRLCCFCLSLKTLCSCLLSLGPGLTLPAAFSIAFADQASLDTRVSVSGSQGL